MSAPVTHRGGPGTAASCCPTTAGRSTTTSRAWGSRPCARSHPGATIEFDPPVPALELAALLGVSDPVARTVGVHMSSWEVELGDAVATLEGSATGETYSLPAALGARVVAEDRVRFIRAPLAQRRSRECVAQQTGIRRGGEAAVGEPVDAAAQRRRLVDREQVGAVDADRRRAREALRGRLLLGLDLAHGRPATSSPSAARKSASAAGCDGQPSQYEELYCHLIEQPTGLVCGFATGRPASTSSNAARSHAAFSDGSPWSASGAPR